MTVGQQCTCGCGDTTKGGRFLPGHDQKLRAEIERQAGGLEELRRIVERALGTKIDLKGQA
jgi:hypothetical protein